jgi:hypothetical protein
VPPDEEIMDSPATGTARRKRSWPLLLIAAGAFLPGFGLFFAAAAASWGLVSDRPRARLAVILGGTGGLLNLVGGVLLAWSMRNSPIVASASAANAQRDLAKLVGSLEEYRTASGSYPPELAVFTRPPLSLKFVNVQDFSGGVFVRPRLYQYQRSADGQTYDLYGVGMDGEAGTADDVRPELPDSVARRSGYRPSREPRDGG